MPIDEVKKLYPEHRKFYAVVFEYPYAIGGLESIWSSNQLALWRIGELNSVKGIKPDYHVEEHWLDEPGDEVCQIHLFGAATTSTFSVAGEMMIKNITTENFAQGKAGERIGEIIRAARADPLVRMSFNYEQTRILAIIHYLDEIAKD